MSKPTSPNFDPLPDDSIEEQVYELLRRTGKIIPQTPDEVAVAEQVLITNAIPVPEEIRDPSALFGSCGIPKRLPQTEPLYRINLASERALGRAAREGNQIPPKIADQMTRDRDEAERKADLP